MSQLSIENLPPEIQLNILLECYNMSELLYLCQTNKYFRDLCLLYAQ